MKTTSLALVALAAVGLAADDGEAMKDLKALEGTWEYVSQVADGKEVPKEMLEVTKDTWKHCFAMEKRPEKFASEDGDKVTYAVLRRVKK